jgi:hypothetical protein
VSLTGPDFWSPEQGGVMLTAAGRTCHYCERPTEDPAVMWAGPEADTFLHVLCVPDYVMRLHVDLWTWQKRTGHRFGAAA